MMLITAVILIDINGLGGGVTTSDRDAHRPCTLSARCAV